jgi:hypothetical protein
VTLGSGLMVRGLEDVGDTPMQESYQANKEDEEASEAAGDEADGSLDAPVLPAPPSEPRPTLDEYRVKWCRKLEWHARPVPGAFERGNLVPTPIPNLWQDCPYVPFEELNSTESQARLSACRPHTSLEEASCVGGIPRYAHVTGDVCYRRRALLQLASTMGFVLNQRCGQFMGLTPAETDAVHECLTWGRQPSNNKILSFFGTVYESFQGACKKLMDRFQSVLPEGCHRARIRATRRESREPKEGTIGETLGEEAQGLGWAGGLVL